MAIVIPCFNRGDSLKRLLKSINNAIYGNHKPVVIFSIDGGGDKKTIDVANDFEFFHGTKIVIHHNINLGLKRNILYCGGMTNEYDVVILLEDDLFVSPLFYMFTLQSIDYYKDNERIAGISLYSPRFNETTTLPFLPIKDGYDSFFMQIPSSWGQAWNKKQWTMFNSWLSKNEILNDDTIKKLPLNFQQWGGQSWKKYFSAYIFEENKLFVYPYESLTTNFCSPGGVHIKEQVNFLQSPLFLSSSNYYFKFPKNIKDGTVYDMFCENISDYMFFCLMKYVQDVSFYNTCIDLNGSKNEDNWAKKKYILTTKKIDDELIKFTINLKPIENNILMECNEHQINSDAIYFCDTSNLKSSSKHYVKYDIIEYYAGFPVANPRYVLPIIYRFLGHIFNKIKCFIFSSN